jgi:hypothetical protein
MTVEFFKNRNFRNKGETRREFVRAQKNVKKMKEQISQKNPASMQFWKTEK